MTLRSFAARCGALFVLVTGAAYFWSYHFQYVVWGGGADSMSIYQTAARTPIFTGFITMGSFLLAMKSGILGRLKEAYDSDEYASDYDEKLALGNRSAADFPYYGPLERLSKALGWNVIFCFLTSFCQMTLGFWNNHFAYAVCVGTAVTCLGLVLYLTAVLMKAHREWFRKIEEDIQKKRRAARPGTE